MRNLVKKLALVATVTVVGAVAYYGNAGADAGTEAFAPVRHLPRAHSHNDYVRSRPLLDALGRGFASIEVDIFWVDGELLVAHELDEVSASATLRGLYLDPLREIVRRNGGSAYEATEESLQLLIDVKSDAHETYVALARTLREYPDLFTTWTADGIRPGPVTAVLSGNRAVEAVAAEAERHIAIDGRIDDDSSTTTDLMPLVSASWESLGSSHEERLATARPLVARLHSEGRRVRFWATPERPEVWRALVDMGVDYIGTDRVGQLHQWLSGFDATAD